ncbi:MAG: MucBP domain-containing protein [Bacilli bacterium]|nr:MucBP domain-containing protein [Bacilli bacterium]
MKKLVRLVFSLALIILIGKNVFASTPAIHGEEYQLDDHLINVGQTIANPTLDSSKFVNDYLNVDGNNYGVFIVKNNYYQTTPTGYAEQVVHNDFAIENTSDKTMHVSLMMPYSYIWGYNKYELSYNGEPFLYNNDNNHFYAIRKDYSNTEKTTEAWISDVSGGELSFPQRDSDVSVEQYLLTDPFSKLGTPDISGMPFIVKELASFNGNDNYIKIDLGTIAAHQSKDITYLNHFIPLLFANSNKSTTGYRSYLLVNYKIDTSVQINYLDENGNKLSASSIINGYIGDDYTTSPKTINNYQIVSTPNNASGIFKDEVLQINYVYKLDHHVYYDANGGTGTLIDNDSYNDNANVSIESPIGFISNNDLTFLGWNTTSNGSGTMYQPQDIVNIGNKDLTLYAIWSILPNINDIKLPTNNTNNNSIKDVSILKKSNIVKNATPLLNIDPLPKTGNDYLVISILIISITLSLSSIYYYNKINKN